MNRFHLAVLMILQQVGLCYGHVVCIRNPSSVCHNGQRGSSSRLMAEPPSPSSHQENLDTAVTDRKEETPNRISKRTRLSNLVRRFRFRLPSFLRFNKQQSIQQEGQGAPEDIIQSSNSYGMLQLEELEGQPPSTDEAMGEVSEEHNHSARQSRAADNVDLSGTWRPIVTSEFKKEYDSYLVNCSQSLIFRKVVVNGIGLQKEIIRQINSGVDLEIIATNPAGNWNRTLIASEEFEPLNVTITDPDGDKVQVEAWWADNGTKHKSLLRGKPNVCGGVFETVRYLESDDVLVCDSSFIPSPSSPTKFKYGNVLWKFQRVDA